MYGQRKKYARILVNNILNFKIAPFTTDRECDLCERHAKFLIRDYRLYNRSYPICLKPKLMLQRKRET